MTIFELLALPFPPASVHWRVGSTNQAKTSGLALAYVDARDVMERLDSVVGPGNWQNRYPHANGKTVCEIGIKVDGEWIWKADGSGDTDVEAEKGALSDAFKRAAVRWGIGQYLYGLGNVWVEIEPMGRSYKIKDSEKTKLANSLPTPPTAEQIANFDKVKEAISNAVTLAAIDAVLTERTAEITGLTEDMKARLRNVVRFVREARKVAS